MSEDSVLEAGAFGDSRHVYLVAVFKIEVLVGVRKPGAGWADIVGMITSDAESPAVIVPDDVRPRQGKRHEVGNEQIGLTQDESARVKIDVELVQRRVVGAWWVGAT